MTWLEIGREEDFPVSETRELVVAGRVLAVGRDADGEWFALDGVCPHQGGPLGKGSLDGCVLTCPWHGWQFDITDGQSLLSPHVKHPTIPIKSEAGTVLVKLAE